LMTTSPGPLKMAVNFAQSVIEHVTDGGRKASPEVQAARKATCQACPLWDSARDRCNSCGCVAMDLKRSWASSRCPEGHWGAE
jgi:hypothetical protein